MEDEMLVHTQERKIEITLAQGEGQGMNNDAEMGKIKNLPTEEKTSPDTGRTKSQRKNIQTCLWGQEESMST